MHPISKSAVRRAFAGRLEAFQLAFSNPEEAGRFLLGQKDRAVMWGSMIAGSLVRA